MQVHCDCIDASMKVGGYAVGLRKLGLTSHLSCYAEIVLGRVDVDLVSVVMFKIFAFDHEL